MSKLIAAVVLVLSLTACGLTEPKCSQGESCRGSSGKCYTCDAPYSCNSGGTCSASVDGVACCGGGGGGSGFYVNGSGCSGGATYVYSGSNSSTCYSYYNAAVAAHCTKILWKCN